MVVVLFRSRLRSDPAPGYAQTAARMMELAARMPGFRSVKHFEAEDGERLTVVEYESEEAVRAWRDEPEHREAQRRGRSDWYHWYRLQTCQQLREATFEQGG